MECVELYSGRGGGTTHGWFSETEGERIDLAGGVSEFLVKRLFREDDAVCDERAISH